MRITRRQVNFVLKGSKDYPGVSNSELWNGVLRACSGESQSYSKIANIEWGSGSMITFTTEVKYGVWARAFMGGWGRGTIKYSTHPDTMMGWKKFREAGNINEVLFKLAFHELGHLLANTEREDIGYPPKEWLIQVLQRHYGKPKAKIATPKEEEAKVIELPITDLSWL